MDYPPLKLDWNESTIPPSPRVIQAIQEFLAGAVPLHWYPDLEARRLREALSVYSGVPADGILATNGSDAALDLICRTYLDPGDDVLVAWPTYGHFLVFARARGIIPTEVAAPDPFAATTGAILDRLRPSTQLVYLASPNNPTGVVTSVGDIEKLCRASPSTLFVVDEAYHEFCGETCASLVGTVANLIVTRTFSKCFSIAGLRVGYLLTSREVVEQLSKLHNPKSVNAIGQVAALAAIEDRAFRDGYVAEVRAGANFLVQALRERGAVVQNTRANFILIRLADPARFVRALEQVAVYVRDRSRIRGFEGFVRITVGTREQMEDLVRRLDKLLAIQPDLLNPPCG